MACTLSAHASLNCAQGRGLFLYVSELASAIINLRPCERTYEITRMIRRLIIGNCSTSLIWVGFVCHLCISLQEESRITNSESHFDDSDRPILNRTKLLVQKKVCY